MKRLDVEDLRALIRLIPSARALIEQVEKSIHLELYFGAGDLAVRNYRGLLASARAITDDAFLDTLTLDNSIDSWEDDRQKVAQVMMAAGQLIAYLEAQTGVNGSTSARGHYSVQTAPNIHIDMGDVIGGQVDRIMDVVKNAMKGIPKTRGGMPPMPPMPPHSPQPPQPPQRGRPSIFEAYVEIEGDDEGDEDRRV